MTAEEIIPYGTLVRVTEDHEMDRMVYEGTEFIVDGMVPAGDEEAGDYPFDWYYGVTAFDSTVDAAADKIEVVKTAQQMRERKIPTAEEIVMELDGLGDYDGFRIDEADIVDGNSRELVGRTHDGLYFACTITVSNVYQADY